MPNMRKRENNLIVSFFKHSIPKYYKPDMKKIRCSLSPPGQGIKIRDVHLYVTVFAEENTGVRVGESHTWKNVLR